MVFFIKMMEIGIIVDNINNYVKKDFNFYFYFVYECMLINLFFKNKILLLIINRGDLKYLFF